MIVDSPGLWTAIAGGHRLAKVSSVLERYYHKTVVVVCYAVLRQIFCFDKKILFLLKKFPVTHLDYLNNVQLPLQQIVLVS